VQARRTVVDRPSFQTAPVTMTIIAACVAIFAAGFVSPELENELFDRFALVNVDVAAGEWWRVLTATFLHGGLWHIFFNMYALYVFGPRLELQVGSMPFALLYFASAAGGGAASYLFGPSQVEVMTQVGPVLVKYTSVGASGAIFGLFGAWMYVAFKLRSSPAGRAMFNQLGALLLINLALPLFIPNIDWRAHVGGLLAGIAIAALWGQFAVGRRNVMQIRTMIAGAVFAGLMLLVILG
jgi:membrane associated rhomboid family serine protease